MGAGGGPTASSSGRQLDDPNLTLASVAQTWLDRGTGVTGRWEPGTLDRYERIVRSKMLRSQDRSLSPLGSVRLRDLDVDRVAAWSAANERAFAPTTAAFALRVLGTICRFAVRRGLLREDPVGQLERGEKPPRTAKKVAVLSGPDLGRFLAEARSYRPLFELLAFTGLRIGEALGLYWDEVDLSAGRLRVARQLTQGRVLKEPKSSAGVRDVVLAASVIRLLASLQEHRSGGAFVFCNEAGRCLDQGAVRDAFERTYARSGIEVDGRLSLHSLRHGYASMLIAEGLDVVFVSRQLGHAKPTTTLATYAHLFERANHAGTARRAVENAYRAVAAGLAEGSAA